MICFFTVDHQAQNGGHAFFGPETVNFDLILYRSAKHIASISQLYNIANYGIWATYNEAIIFEVWQIFDGGFFALFVAN